MTSKKTTFGSRSSNTCTSRCMDVNDFQDVSVLVLLSGCKRTMEQFSKHFVLTGSFMDVSDSDQNDVVKHGL